MLSTVLLLAALAAAAVAADPAAAPPAAVELDGPKEPAQPGPGGSIQSGIAGCVLWTDRCTVCQREGSLVTCSNIGVACQPEALICLREVAAPAKNEKEKEKDPDAERANADKKPETSPEPGAGTPGTETEKRPANEGK
jgi:hypothetical protein